MPENSGEIAVLRELEQRLSDRALTLSDMADDCPADGERQRLRAKAEGVNLALSFVQEAIREATFSDSSGSSE